MRRCEQESEGVGRGCTVHDEWPHGEERQGRDAKVLAGDLEQCHMPVATDAVRGLGVSALGEGAGSRWVESEDVLELRLAF